MKRRRLNVKMFLLFVGLSVAFVVGFYLLHRVQVQKTATYQLKLADRAAEAGDLQAEADALERYLGFRKKDREVMARWGMVLAKKAKTSVQKKKAAEILESVAQSDPSKTAELKKAAELFTELGQTSDRSFSQIAAVLWKSLADANPNDALILAKHATAIAGISSRVAEAEPMFEKAVKLAPNDVDIYIQYAYYLKTRRDNPGQGATILNKMVSANPNNAKAYVERARYRVASNPKISGYLEDLDQARKLKPDDADMRLLTASIYLSEAKPDQAIAELAPILDANADSFAVYNMLAMAQVAANKLDDAIITYKRGVAALPEATELQYMLGETYVATDKFEEAKAVIDALKGKPGLAITASYLEGYLAFGQKKWPEAIKLFQNTATQLGALPNNVRSPELERKSNFFEGQAEERLANPQRALAAYQRALAASPNNPLLRMRIAGILTSLSRFDEAARTYRELPATYPGARASLVRTRLLQNASLAPEKRRWDDIEAYINELERTTPNVLPSLTLRATYLLARGETDKARALIEKARLDFPKEVGPSLALAELLRTEKKYDEALKTLDQAQATFGDKPEIRSERIRYWAIVGGIDATKKADALKNIEKLGDDISKFTQVEQAGLMESLSAANRRLGNLAQSNEQLKSSIAQAPDDIRLRVRELEQAIESGNMETIETVVEQLKRLEGSEGVFWRYGEANRLFFTAEKAKTKEGLEQARTLLNEALARRSDQIPTERLLALVDDLDGKYEAAIPRMQKVFDAGVRQPYLLRRLSFLLLERNRYTEANKVMTAVQAQGLRTPEEKKLTAEIAVRAGDKDRALLLLKEAVDPANNDPASFNWLSMMYRLNNQPAEAEAAARKAIALSPALGAAQFNLVLAILASGDKSRAAAAAETAEKTLPAANKLEHAEIAQAISNYPLANKWYDEALAENPKEMLTLRQCAQFYLASNQFDKAIAAYRKMISVHTSASPITLSDIRLALAQALLNSRRPKALLEAENLVDQNLQDKPNSITDLRMKISILSILPGRRSEALKLFGTLRAKQPLSLDENFALAQLYDAEGQWESVRQQMQFVLNVPAPPLRPGLWYINRLLRRNELAQAEIWINKFEKQDPKALDLAMLRARWYSQNKQNPEALSLMQAKSREAPNFTPLFARVLEETKQQEAAIKMLRDYVKVSQQQTAPLVLAEALTRAGQLPEALDIIDASWGKVELPQILNVISTMIETPACRSDSDAHARLLKVLQDAAAKNPKSIAVLNTIAQIHVADRKFAEAEEYYNKALALAPNDASIFNNMAWMLMFVPGRAQDGISLVQKAIDAEGPEAHFLDTRGLGNLATGNSAAAMADFEQSIEGRPHDLPTVYFHKALASEAAGKRVQANEAMRTAESLGFKPDSLHTLETPSYEALLAKLGAKK